MRSRFWISSLLISTIMIGGCSAGDTQPENESEKNQAMDHTKMEPEQKMGDMEEMGGHMSHENPPALNDSTEENELAIPPLLEPKDGSYPITAQQGTTEILEGIQTETYGYNGSFLGPVIRIKRGDAVTFKTRNELTEPTTFHWHGLDIPGKGDGGPHQIIEPGETKEVKFTVNQEASTLWFHPHQKGITAEQVYKGLAGLIYVEDENSQKLGLPDHYGVNDFPLVFQDRQFDDQNQLNFKAVHNDDGTIGNTLLVNGTLNPKLTVGAEKVRLRLLNGSNARNYTFKLNTGDSFQQIATDGGFLNEPLERSEITLTPGERAEIIVDFSKQNSVSDIALLNEEGTILLPFKVKEEQTNSAELPENLNDYKVTDEERNLPVSKRLELFGMGRHVTINGKQFDMNRIDLTQKEGETEIWEVYNKPDPMGGMIHPFHIHGTQFKIVSIDGGDPPEILQGWKDTVAIEPGQTVKLAVKFNNKGIYMYHCHLLEHEDNGMMGQVEVN